MDFDPRICPPASRPFVAAVLALRKKLTHKEVGTPGGFSTFKVSRLFRSALIKDAIFARLLPGLRARPAEIAVVASCHEALEALEADSLLTPEEREVLELELLEDTRRRRELLTQLVLHSRAAVPLDEYPKPGDVEPARWLAREQLAALRKIPLEHRASAVKVSRGLQNWALAEAAVHESVELASRELKEAKVWAQVAVEIGERVLGPESWCKRVRGYAGGAMSNVLRVVGDHKAAEAELEAAKRLWLAGSDPDQLLDPGWLLDVEGALRRDQRKFDEALSCFDRSRPLSRPAARPLIMKGFTYEVMGEYESAIATLLEAEPLLDPQTAPRLWYQQRFNLAVLYTHLGHYAEATALLDQVRELVIEQQNRIDLSRVTWLQGRIAAGLGRREEALSLLAQARKDFEGWDMWYDVALALVEEAALLLEEGRTAEVKALALGLVKVFQSRQIQPEALVALQLFQKAVERDEATSEQARNVLRFLFRARHDPSLRFES